jgi:hypothetical protein
MKSTFLCRCSMCLKSLRTYETTHTNAGPDLRSSRWHPVLSSTSNYEVPPFRPKHQAPQYGLTVECAKAKGASSSTHAFLHESHSSGLKLPRSAGGRAGGGEGGYIPRFDREDLEGHVRRRPVVNQQHDARADLNLMDVLVCAKAFDSITNHAPPHAAQGIRWRLEASLGAI